jgi:hypothetical protein
MAQTHDPETSDELLGAGQVIRIGVLTPHVTIGSEAEFAEIAPGHLVTRVVRVTGDRQSGGDGGPASATALRAAAELPVLERAARELVGEGVDVIGYASTTSAYVIGFGAESAIVSRLSQLTGLPVASTCAAAVLALHVLEVRRVALVGLARCHDPRTRAVLLATLNRREETPSLRALAAGLMAESGDRGAAPQLAAALRGLVAESAGDLALQGAAIAVLRALARLGGPDAVITAVTLAGDTGRPYRAPAIEALGTLCDPGAGAAALQKLATGRDANLAEAAARAQKRCATK